MVTEMLIFNLHRSDKSGAEKLAVKISILWLSANYFKHFQGHCSQAAVVEETLWDFCRMEFLASF